MRKRTITGLAGIGLLVVLSGGVTGPAYATGGHGHGHTPVTICHNGHTITVDDSALPGHLKHGDTVGECTPAPEPTAPVETPAPEPTTPVETPAPEPTTPVETPAPEPTAPVETPAPEPTTPVETPAPVIVPQVQDYVTCRGGAFVLDNIGSTVDVTFTVNGLPYVVPAGAAVHTDADGTILQPNSDFSGFTIEAGGRTWNFPSGGNCGTDPTTGCPTVGDPTVPCDGGPVVTPPTDEPTTPAPTDEPSTAPTTPTDETTPPASSTPAPSDVPTPASTSPTSSAPTPAVTNTVAPVAADTTRTASLAYTGSEGLVAGGITAAGLAALGALVLVLRTRARRADR